MYTALLVWRCLFVHVREHRFVMTRASCFKLSGIQFAELYMADWDLIYLDDGTQMRKRNKLQMLSD